MLGVTGGTGAAPVEDITTVVVVVSVKTSISSSVSRGPPTPGSAGSHARKPSEFGAVERFKLNHLEGGDISRRNSMPSRLRTASVSTTEGSVSDSWSSGAAVAAVGTGTVTVVAGHEMAKQPEAALATPPSSVASIDLKRAPDPNDRAVTCLLAEDNPITAKIIETLLIRLGCRCVVVADGSEAISVAMGDISGCFHASLAYLRLMNVCCRV